MGLLNIRGAITYTDEQAEGFTPRQLNKHLCYGLTATTESWHKTYLRGHFDPSAFSKYGYKQRSRKNVRAKAKKYHANLPLVMSGELRRQVRLGIRARMKTETGRIRSVIGVMQAPKYLYMYRKDYKQPDKHAELVAVSQSELMALAQYNARKMEESIRATKSRRTVAVK